ncbi:hypothetical protein [Pusillimonas sp.]|uniref:hypothetical protein n=1 Tax=Pusillimonas sp. TaxID=3040095 RepID=UPI0029A7D07D|nr:hypothetical protein [Pusillimonas sp.]MDX3895637.1 hypothetical protein [Pusillimonas sp.]
MDMTPVCTPRSESEAAVIASMMQAYGIDFVMQGGAFSTMYPGPVSTSLNAQVLLVRMDQADMARELLAGFMEESEQAASKAGPEGAPGIA